MFVAGTLIEAGTSPSSAMNGYELTLTYVGSDTTRNQNNVLIAHAAHDPRWLPKVREQLDKVCGANAERLPEYTDWEDLTYIHATIKEALRIFPNLVQLGAPHALS